MIKQLTAFQRIPSAGNVTNLFSALEHKTVEFPEPIPPSVTLVPTHGDIGYAVIGDDPDGQNTFIGALYMTDDGWFTMANQFYVGTFRTREESVTAILKVYE